MSKRPDDFLDIVKGILSEYYGINDYNSELLDAYEDFNLHVTTADELPGSPTIEYTFKAFRDVDRDFGSYLDLQVDMMQHLHLHGTKVPKPIPLKTGQLWGTINHYSLDSEEQLYFVLLEYVSGITLKAAGNPQSLMQEVGQLAGMVDSILKSFSPVNKPNLHIDSDSTWNLPEMNYLMSRLPEYLDENVAEMGEDICQQCLKDVIPLLSTFQRGYIHGDFNDCNIIVKPKEAQGGTTDYQISGLIDFGDIQESYYVYELAILMADLTSASLEHADPLDIIKSLLKGYRQEFKLCEPELKSLRLLICVRLLHYYVLTGDSLKDDPSNFYLQTCLDREGNIKMFKCLYNTDEHEFRCKVEIKDLG